MKKYIKYIVGITIILVGGAAYLFWNATTKPLYEPGSIKTEQNLRSPLTPPTHTPQGLDSCRSVNIVKRRI